MLTKPRPLDESAAKIEVNWQAGAAAITSTLISCERKSLPAPLAIDRIWDPNEQPAPSWDCVESLLEQVRLGQPLTRRFRDRVSTHLPLISYEHVLRANRFSLAQWLVQEAERQAQLNSAAESEAV